MYRWYNIHMTLTEQDDAGGSRMKTTRTLRRASQWVVFLLFAFLFLNTEYKDNDVLPYAVNLFLRLDPLMAGAATLAGRALIGLVWPALVVALLTVALGRFFCGWFCPLGAVIDAADATVFRKARRKDAVPVSWRRYKFLILFFLAASSLFTLQWVFLFDPISILIRTFTVSVFPALNLVLHQIFDGLYRMPGPIPGISEPVYGFLKSHFLAFEQPVFRTSAIVGLLFLGILAAERYQRRFWCRNLCPLGGLLALMGRFGLFRRRITEAGCTRCGLCESNCRMGAIGGDVAVTDHGECIECMDCQAVCPEEVIHFSGKEGRKPAAVDLTRRGVLASAALGAVTVPFFRVEAHGKAQDPLLIRPPGALPEGEFLARCTRCGECMRVCIANGLQPTWFEAGLEGMWSPILVSQDRVLRIQLHALRTGLPDRRDPAPPSPGKAEGEAGPRVRRPQPMPPVGGAVRLHRLRGALSDVEQGDRAQGGEDAHVARGVENVQEAVHRRGSLRRVRDLRDEVPADRSCRRARHLPGRNPFDGGAREMKTRPWVWKLPSPARIIP